MCLKHMKRTFETAIFDQVMPWDIMREIIKYTDTFMKALDVKNRVETREVPVGPQSRAVSADSVVYYIRLTRGRIKIGYTTNLVARMKAHRASYEDLLMAEPGGRGLEADRHHQFEHLRIGRTEDFREAPDLLEHIAKLKIQLAS